LAIHQGKVMKGNNASQIKSMLKGTGSVFLQPEMMCKNHPSLTTEKYGLIPNVLLL
jgi:hypothetical protein